jgi:hypothetical protein
MALRAMKRHVHFISDPYNISTKLHNFRPFHNSRTPCAPTLYRFFTSRLRSSETRNQLFD